MSLGCNHMISQGAGIITDIEEGLLEIRQMILERTEHADKCNKAQDNTGLHNINRQKNPYLPDDLKGRLYACMDYMPKTMQQLYEEIGDANIAEIMTALCRWNWMERLWKREGRILYEIVFFYLVSWA